MTQMRKDVFTDRWVLIAESSTVLPADFHFKKFVREAAACPFCEGNEGSTPAEVFAIRKSGSLPNTPGWSVRVVPNSVPRLRIEGELGRRGEGIHDLMNGVGAHEIIVETPQHDRGLHELTVQEVSDVIRASKARILDLEGDRRIRYVLIFKNQGEEAGAHTISHSISQLMALAVTPITIKTKLNIAREYFSVKERCIYCDVLAQELRAKKRLIAENEHFVAFAPFASRFPFEIAVLPKTHESGFSHLDEDQIQSLSQILSDVLRKLNRTLGGPPYNLSVQDRPFLRKRPGYWKTIEDDFHWHLEILPQIARMTGFEWGSGFFYNPVSPEAAAKHLSSAGDSH